MPKPNYQFEKRKKELEKKKKKEEKLKKKLGRSTEETQAEQPAIATHPLRMVSDVGNECKVEPWKISMRI